MLSAVNPEFEVDFPGLETHLCVSLSPFSYLQNGEIVALQTQRGAGKIEINVKPYANIRTYNKYHYVVVIIMKVVRDPINLLK